MVVLDTSVIIDHLRQGGSSESLLMKCHKKFGREAMAISVISVQELFEGRSTRDARLEDMLLATIAPLKVLSYGYETARLAGELARDSRLPVEFADGAIAATAISNGASLLTLNKKVFLNFKNLKIEALG